MKFEIKNGDAFSPSVKVLDASGSNALIILKHCFIMKVPKMWTCLMCKKEYLDYPERITEERFPLWTCPNCKHTYCYRGATLSPTMELLPSSVAKYISSRTVLIFRVCEFMVSSGGVATLYRYDGKEIIRMMSELARFNPDEYDRLTKSVS